MTNPVLHFRTALPLLKMFAFIIFAASATMGQAGRKIPKRVESVPVPTPSAEPAPQTRPRPKPDFVVKVATEISDNVRFTFPMPERMETWFMERLEKAMLLEVLGVSPANRRDAINQAKGETETYVVWLQLEDDVFGSPSASSRPAAGQVWINLSIFSPVTGKAKYSRKIVLNQDLSSGGSISSKVIRSCHNGIYGNNFLLLEASITAADSVMSAFNIPIPPDCP